MKDLAKWSSSDRKTEKINIPFHIPLITGYEQKYVLEAIQNKYLGAEGFFSQKCSTFLENLTESKKVIMTTSCTDALEMAAILSDIKEGDEVIMSSYNFVSAANAFVLRGALIRFIDIDPITMNMDANLIESAISQKTKVIVAMHYAGVPCDMDKIMKIANQYQLLVVEDAAHCIGAYYKGRHLGSIGHLGTLSFHETKNIQCGEGGALLINDERLIYRAQIIRDKGTDRSDFRKGMVKKYTWVDVGSSFGLGELHAAFLYGQFSFIQDVNEYRVKLWKLYYSLFSEHPAINISNECGNGHIFYLKFNSEEKREKIVKHLLSCNISSFSHYEPLHLSIGGIRYGHFIGEDNFTTIGSKMILRLPLHNELIINDVLYIFQCIMKKYEM
jgi:dTDP-4-amino-4,6-dideoxygalactose transaminase